MKTFWQIFLRRKGWSVKGAFPHHLNKYIIIVGPHTSNTDFIMGLAFRSVAGISHARFLAKDTLFKWPFGFLFRKAGGIPVFRNTNNNLVDQVVDYFKKNQKFVLALSPEGTRKKTEKLKTGFYYIAR
ncbi:MAG TPA: 1-acyl-sn-glycerol-3-phosphate acyltransferase, partial [Chitinophagaceae bacterium]